MRFLIVLVAALCALAAQPIYAASCLCTAGCKITSDPYLPGADVPETCTVYKAGVAVASAPVVPSLSIPSSNSSVCAPSSGMYNQGPVGAVSCLVTIPAQAAGAVTVTMTASNALGESPPSAPFTFTNVAVLPKAPPATTNLRVTP